MKLIFCLKCGDIVALRQATRSCDCGGSTGYYKDDNKSVVIEGPCVPMYIQNSLVGNAMRPYLRDPRNTASFPVTIIGSDAPVVQRIELSNA